MRRIFVLILISVLTGCASPGTVPNMPTFNTVDGKYHARECQASYAACVSACSREVGYGAVGAYQRKKALNNCNEILEDCYKTCE